MTRTRTAEYVAFYRALESLERGREPLFRDPYAPLFLGPGLALSLSLARRPAFRRIVERSVDRGAPGARLAHAARTRFIDDLVRTHVARGVRQLVVLGAGFDCRAHRLDELGKVSVFEVDLAGTQAEKRTQLGRTSGKVRADVNYVPADLVRDDVRTRLEGAGFDAALPAVFVLEGVVNYLPSVAVLRMLAWIARTSPGSSVVFSYVHNGLLDGSLEFPGSGRFRRLIQTLREPWLSGFHPSALPEQLSKLGLVLREDLGADEYRRRYLGEAAETERFAFYRLAVAEVC